MIPEIKREITFQQYRENLAKAGVFRWVTNIHEHKRYYYAFDNSLLFTQNIQNTTQIFPHEIANVPVSSVSAPGRWHNAAMLRAKAWRASVLIIPGHSRKFPVRAMDIVNPGNTTIHHT